MKRVLLGVLSLTLPAILNAQTYTGVSGCQGCHSGFAGDQYVRWAQTRHAVAYDSAGAFVQGNASCLPCHTTGWDTTAANGGFDDYFKTSDATGMAKMKNVQCEACHGPVVFGGNHGNPETVNPDAQVCGTCHEGEHHPYYSEWQQSLHARADTSLYSSFLTSSFRNDPNCSGCHTHQGFMEFLKDTAGLVPNVQDPPGDAAHPLVCASCHDPHGTANVGDLRLPVTKMCTKCHNPEYPPDSVDARLGPEVHNSTAYMFEGIGGYEYSNYAPGYASSVHKFIVTDKCAECHVSTAPFQAGPPVIAAATGHTFMPEKRACATGSCHPTIDTTQSEDVVFNYKNRQHECDSIAAILAGKLAQASPADSATDAFKRAKFNYEFFESDGSHGVHNTNYAKALLESAILNFTPTVGVDPVGGQLPNEYALSQNYPNPFNPSTMISFAIPARGTVRLTIYSVDGKLVKTLVDNDMEAGTYRVSWQGDDLNGAKVSTGIYLYKLQAGSFTATKKMLMLK